MKNNLVASSVQNTPAGHFDVAAMAEFYKTHTLVETAKQFGTNYTTLRGLFDASGITIRKQGPYYNGGLADSDRAEIWATRHFVNGETLQAIGTDYGVTRERVRQVVAKYRETLGKNIVDRNVGVEAENAALISQHAANGLSVTEIAESIEISPANVAKIAKRNNIEIPRKKKSRRDDIVQTAAKVAELYQNDVSAKDITLKLGLSCPERVYYLLNVAGVSERRKKQTVE